LASKRWDPVDVVDVDGENLLVITPETWPLVDHLGSDDIGMIFVDPPKPREADIVVGDCGAT